jgi:putative ABC transport system permease protein
MEILSAIKIAWRAMHANKVRTSLTILGMVIGISSVIIVFSAGEGISSLITGQVESFGTDVIETEIKVPTNKKGAAAEQQSATALVTGAQVTTLNLDDLEDINKLSNIKGGYAAIMGQEQIGYGNELRKAFVFGVNSSYIDIDRSEIDYGRFFTDAEDKSMAQVVVLGSKMKDKLFGDSDAIGKSIKLRKSKYRVIGVMKERGAVMTMDFDDYVYIPIRTLQKKVMGINHVLYMIHQLNDLNLADETAEEMRYILRENHDLPHPTEIYKGWTDTIGKDDFRVVTMSEMMETLDIITGALTLLLLAIVAISLLVGGVGIMNIMYVIVSERTGEIGLRKAVGAKYSNIMWQFLSESILITIAGGVIGIILGGVVSFLIFWGANSYGLDWKFGIPIKAYFVSFGFSLFFGIVFGLYPARRAAQMQPIEALHKE